MISIYSPDDIYVWIPVAEETEQYPARAFLPFIGSDATYIYGYKARTSKGMYFEALKEIQKSYINNTSEVFLVKNGTKKERQYKAKWRHGREQSSPILGPTKGWVKLPVNDILKVSSIELAEAIERAGAPLAEMTEAIIAPLLCSTDEELVSESEKLRKLIIGKRPLGQRAPATTQGMTYRFVRDAAVVAYVLNQANGFCEGCNTRAPFSKANGEPYLEVHHVRTLAKGGTDTVANAVALCPNCHREMHHGVNAASLLEHIYTSVSRLERE